MLQPIRSTDVPIFIILLGVGALAAIAFAATRSRQSASAPTGPASEPLEEIQVSGKRIEPPAGAPVGAQPVIQSTSGIAGIDNNNPTNLRYVESIKWVGQIGSRKGFAVFDTAQNGLRAGFVNLWTGFNKYSANTVRKVITRLSPPNENPTQAYVIFVADRVGVTIDQPLTYGRHAIPIVKAIVRFENGRDPYPDSLYQAAYNSAGKA